MLKSLTLVYGEFKISFKLTLKLIVSIVKAFKCPCKSRRWAQHFIIDGQMGSRSSRKCNFIPIFYSKVTFKNNFDLPVERWDHHSSIAEKDYFECILHLAVIRTLITGLKSHPIQRSVTSIHNENRWCTQNCPPNEL